VIVVLPVEEELLLNVVLVAADEVLLFDIVLLVDKEPAVEIVLVAADEVLFEILLVVDRVLLELALASGLVL